MVNSALSLAQARRLAGELESQTPANADSAFVAAAFERVLCRMPTDQEHAACQQFLDEQSRRLAEPASLAAFSAGGENPQKPATDPHQRARENLVHVLLNHNDFVTVR
jgi:hypothetical protein